MMKNNQQDKLCMVYDSKQSKHKHVHMCKMEEALLFIEHCDYMVQLDDRLEHRNPFLNTIGESIYLWNIENIDILANLGVNLHIKNDLFLHTAALRGQDDVVRHLIEQYHSDIHSENDRVIRIACRTGNLNLTKLLIEKYTDIQPILWDIISEACNKKHNDIVLYLLPLLTDPLKQDDLIILAIKRGNIDLLSKLLNSGYKLNELPKGKLSNIYMSYAALSGRVDTIKLLISHNCNPTYETMLVAANHGQIKVVSYLIGLGISLNNIEENAMNLIIKEANTLSLY